MEKRGVAAAILAEISGASGTAMSESGELLGFFEIFIRIVQATSHVATSLDRFEITLFRGDNSHLRRPAEVPPDRSRPYGS